jgi:hypothetical protein
LFFFKAEALGLLLPGERCSSSSSSIMLVAMLVCGDGENNLS